MKKSNSDLHSYSLFATTFLLLYSNKIKPQVIYTDIDPDHVLEMDYEFALINMDINESNDFVFLKTSGSWYTEYYFDPYFLHQDFAGPYYEENQMAGFLVTHGAGGASTYFAYKLQIGDLVDDDVRLFNNAPGQQLASMIITSNGELHLRFGEFANDTTDGYLGVKFIDEESCYHYGWIRLAVVDSCRKMIIKDYAYEVQCDHPIMAGSTEHYVGIEESSDGCTKISIYSFSDNIYIHIPAEFTGEYEFCIYTLGGIKVFNRKVNDIITIIPVRQTEGIYIAELVSKKARLVQKLFLSK